MSRSKKKHNIVKDRGLKRYYHRRVRSRLAQIVREYKYYEENFPELPNPKTIMDDYDYCDYWIFDETKKAYRK